MSACKLPEHAAPLHALQHLLARVFFRPVRPVRLPEIARKRPRFLRRERLTILVLVQWGLGTVGDAILHKQHRIDNCPNVMIAWLAVGAVQ